MINKNRFLFRLIVPIFPNFNIYTFAASKTTSVGPIYVATSASKLQSWDVEVIDENNCHGKFFPRDKDNHLDHIALQKERPADVVGFYGSISSTVPRLYELAKLYKELGVKTVAGGKHVENLPEEALSNHIDVVAFREGEITIKELLTAWEKDHPLDEIEGIAFLKDNQIIKTPDRPLIENFDNLPYPNFSLLRYAKIHYYPINRTRGCNSKCEFCAVKDKARCSTPQRMFNQVKYLAEKHKARHFFEASDHFAANREEAIEFCRLLAEYQKKMKLKFKFTIQTRITDARYPELLQAMKEANVDTVCIGFESPIDQELLAMKKGYKSNDLLKWTEEFHKYGFFIHGMFIFGYPKNEQNQLQISLREKMNYFEHFIKKAKIDTVQILITIPLPGTELRKRLEEQNRLYPLSQIGWEYYDGQFPLFEPDDNVSPEELQKAMLTLMKKYYSFNNFLRIVNHIMFHFPAIVFFSVITLALGRVRYIVSAFNIWYKNFFRNYLLRFGGYIVCKNWIKNFKKSFFLHKLEKAKIKLSEKANI